MVKGDRLDGWKAIAAHLGRDRSTAIRWHKERGLPVHAVPGGRIRSVFALRVELDAWSAGEAGTSGDVPPEPHLAPAPVVPPAAETSAEAPDPAQPRRARAPDRAAFAKPLTAALLVLLSASTVWHDPRRADPPELPGDPALVAPYIAARHDQELRDAGSLVGAATAFARIARADPRFAPALAGLAEAELLQGEYGVLGEGEALDRAERAAARALARDPDCFVALRVRAFVRFWRDRDPAAAAADFRRAAALNAGDATSHLWFANALADNGNAAAAAAEFAQAQLRDPGSPAIDVDQAWAAWSRGDDREAEQALRATAAQYPLLASPHDCLAMVMLARGDLAGYAREVGVRARLRGEAGLVRYARALVDAVGRGDRAAALALMRTRATVLRQRTPGGDRALEAMDVSAIGDRATLLAVLEAADRAGERWGSAGYRLHIARRWRGDSAILRLLARRAPPAMT